MGQIGGGKRLEILQRSRIDPGSIRINSVGPRISGLPFTPVRVQDWLLAPAEDGLGPSLGACIRIALRHILSPLWVDEIDEADEGAAPEIGGVNGLQQ